MRDDLEALEQDVYEARLRLSQALGTLAADAAPGAVGASAARLGIDWAEDRISSEGARWIAAHPVAVVSCIVGALMIAGHFYASRIVAIAPEDPEFDPRFP